MNNDLNGKRILYIGQSFFGYEIEIKSMLEQMGAEVDYYDERPSNSFYFKLLIRFKLNKLLRKNIHKYYSNIFIAIKNVQYDYVFINKLESLDFDLISQLRTYNKTAKFVLYKWDSINNYKPNMDTLSFFDKAFTFDTRDAKNIIDLKLLPLFYVPAYENLQITKIKYDLAFIGSGHNDRFNIVKKLIDDGSKIGMTSFSFFYLRTKTMFYFRKLFDNKLKSAKVEDFSFSSLSQQAIVSLVAQTNIIIDVEHPTQQGLTMRTIEMIGAKKKLITTNADIKNYDFYHPNNINVINRESPKLDLNFVNLPYVDLKLDIYEKYSLKNWILSVFCGMENSYLREVTVTNSALVETADLAPNNGGNNG